MYFGQIHCSRIRGHHLPKYTKQELKVWCFNQSIFHKLYTEWAKGRYYKMLKPSCDRLDNSKSYTFDNLRIVTFKENASAGGVIGGKMKKSPEHCRNLGIANRGRRWSVKKGAWSLNCKLCSKCKSNKQPYQGRGLCRKCYLKEYNANRINNWVLYNKPYIFLKRKQDDPTQKD